MVEEIRLGSAFPWLDARRKLLTLALLASLVSFSVSACPATIATTQSQMIIHSTLVVPVYSEDVMPKTSVGVLVDRMEIIEEYFVENSYAKVTFNSDVLGWTQLKHSVTSYSALTTYANGATRVTVNHTLFTDVIELLTGVVDFGPYDTLIVIHAGERGSLVLNPNQIGSCFVPGSFPAGDSSFEGAVVVSELDWPRTIAHELTHRLGADDLYDYLQRNISIGPWCVMGSGTSSNGPGGMCAYSKLSIGFLNEHEVFRLTEGTYRVTLSPLSSSHQEFRAIRFDLPDDRYYIIEARNNRVGFDSALPEGGVLVYVVNETGIDDRRGGMDIQFLEGVKLWDDVPLQVGESFANNEDGLALRVLDWTNEGIVVDISTSPNEQWIVCERFAFPEDVDVRDVDLTWGLDVEDRLVYYASIVVKEGEDTYVQFHRSLNLGRRWEKFYDSKDKFAVSSNDNNLLYCDYNLWLVGRFKVADRWYVGAGAYIDYSGEVSIHNLTDIAGEALNYGAQGASDQESLYVAARSGNSTHPALTYFRRHNHVWNCTRVPLNGSLSSWELSNTPSAGGLPYLALRNETGLYLTKFNSTDITLLYEGNAWEAQIVYGENLCVVYHTVIGGNLALQMLLGDPDAGLSLVINRTLATLSFRLLFFASSEQVWLLENEDHELVLHEAEGMSYTTVVLPDIPGELDALAVSPENVTHPLLLNIHEGSVSTVRREYSTPDDPVEVLWFFNEITISNGSDLGVIIGILVGLFILVLVVYYVRKKRK